MGGGCGQRDDSIRDGGTADTNDSLEERQVVKINRKRAFGSWELKVISREGESYLKYLFLQRTRGLLWKSKRVSFVL